jgi:hypothetical protein
MGGRVGCSHGHSRGQGWPGPIPNPTRSTVHGVGLGAIGAVPRTCQMVQNAGRMQGHPWLPLRDRPAPELAQVTPETAYRPMELVVGGRGRYAWRGLATRPRRRVRPLPGGGDARTPHLAHSRTHPLVEEVGRAGHQHPTVSRQRSGRRTRGPQARHRRDTLALHVAEDHRHLGTGSGEDHVKQA